MYKVGEEKQLCYSNSGGQRSSETRACYRAGWGERSTVGTSRQEREVGAEEGDIGSTSGSHRLHWLLPGGVGRMTQQQAKGPHCSERTRAFPYPLAAAAVFNCKPQSTPCREATLSILTLGRALGLRGVLRERSFSFG